MKKIIYFILLILLSNYNLYAQINIDKLIWEENTPNIDFCGTLSIGNNVYAYGTKGMYFYSSDKGINWEQKKIDNATSILKLLNIDNKIIGFTTSGQLLQSDNLGLTWHISTLENVEFICFVDTFLDNIYIRTNKSINIYNKKIELISTFKSDIFNNYDILNKFSLQFIESDLLYLKFSFNFLFYKDELFFTNVISNKIFKLNIKKLLINEIVLDSITICDTCQSGYIGNLRKYNNKLLFYLNNFNDKYQIAYFKYNIDSNHISLNSSKEYKKYDGNFINLNGTNYKFYDNTYNILSDYSSRLYALGVDTLSANDSLTNIGNSDIIGISGVTRISDVCQLSENTFIAVSNNKFLIISNDHCKTWKVISTRGNILFNQPDLIYRNNRYYMDNLVDLTLTDNNGLTYQSVDRNVKEEKFFNLLKNNKISLSAKYLDTNGTFVYFMVDNYNQYYNIAISKDFGKTLTFVNNKDFRYRCNIVNVSKVDDKFIFVGNYQFGKQTYIIYFNFDNEMNTTKRVVDSTYYAMYASFKSLKAGFLLTTIKDEQNKIVVLNWIENSQNWKRDTILSTFFTNFDFYEIGKSKDSVLIVTYNYDGLTNNTYIYIYDNKSKTATKVFEIQSNGFKKFSKYLLEFGNKYFLVGDKFCLENINYNFKQWQEKATDPTISWDRIQKFADSEKYFVSTFNEKNNLNQSFIVSLDPKSDIEIKPNEQTTFYSYPPFPTPSVNEVKSLIYWDMSYNIDHSDIGVYDIYGNKVANKEKISINKLNAYSGYLKWDCSGFVSGVYLIQIKHGTNTSTVRVLVGG